MLRRRCLQHCLKATSLLHKPRDEIDPAQVPTSKVHARSQFPYGASSKGGEVGARNEAAYIDYRAFQPSLLKWLAMPHNLNLLTITPVLFIIYFITADCWGLVLWFLLTDHKYSTVYIERPVEEEQ